MTTLRRHGLGGKKIGGMGEPETGSSKALGGGRAGGKTEQADGLEESGASSTALLPCRPH